MNRAFCLSLVSIACFVGSGSAWAQNPCPPGSVGKVLMNPPYGLFQCVDVAGMTLGPTHQFDMRNPAEVHHMEQHYNFRLEDVIAASNGSLVGVSQWTDPATSEENIKQQTGGGNSGRFGGFGE